MSSQLVISSLSKLNLTLSAYFCRIIYTVCGLPSFRLIWKGNKGSIQQINLTHEQIVSGTPVCIDMMQLRG